MKKARKRGSHRQEDSSDDDDSDHADKKEEPKPPTNTTLKNLDFGQRRELLRKAASEKRRAKQKCRICGQTGHVRRECPGIADGGRGASKFTKSKGDPGAKILKEGTSSSSTKGSKNRGQRSKSDVSETDLLAGPEFPPGFSIKPLKEERTDEKVDTATTPPEPFLYYDATCDIVATIEYIRSGRGKKKLSIQDAVAEYRSAMDAASLSSNYGGCISRSLLKPGRPWSPDAVASPLVEARSDVWFVIGLGWDFLYNDTDNDAALACLLETISGSDEDRIVVGVFCDLDYSPVALSRRGCDRESQLRRLRCTCQAAGRASVPIQIYTSPGVSATPGAVAVTSTEAASTRNPYCDVMSDLKDVLVESTTQFPSLKVHLSCWSGGADHMNSLLQSFPENLWVGFDASVSFAKATHIHECAFDVSLSRVLLETGAKNTTIPTVIARSMGREAFSHSGLIPYVAEALAGYKSSSSLEITAEQVA